MFLFQELTEDYSPGIGLSDSSEELFQRGKGGTRVHRSFFAEKTNKQNM